MIEALVVVAALGLQLASRRALGVANPFQIYFFVWFVTFLGLALARHTFNPTGGEFQFAMLCSMSVAVMLLVANGMQRDRRPFRSPSLSTIELRMPVFLVGQCVATAAVWPVMVRAQMLSGGVDIFTGMGFVRLRSAMTQEGQGYGVLSYFFMLSFVLSSVSLALYRSRRLRLALLILSLVTSLFYAYVSTGRTFVLLLFCLMFGPLVVTRAMRGSGAVTALALLGGAILLVSALAGKGIDLESDFKNNVALYIETMRGYTIAPLVALSELVESGVNPNCGANSLRFFVGLVHSLGLSDVPPVELVKEFTYVPDKTNVYTVYEPYYRDWLAFGFIVPPAFLVVHELLFRRSARVGGVWVFYYSASLYPLIMQFFQDQYASLLSQWIQIAFWFFVLVKPVRREWGAAERQHA